MRTAIVALLLSAALVFAAEPGKIEIEGKVTDCLACKGAGWCWTVGTNRHKPDEPRIVCQQCHGEGKVINRKDGTRIRIDTPAGEVLRQTISVEQVTRDVARAELALAAHKKRLEVAQAELEKARAELATAKAAAEKL